MIVLGGWGANADNATILDRNYSAGWLVVAGFTVACVVAALMFGSAFGRRRRGPGARGR